MLGRGRDPKLDMAAEELATAHAFFSTASLIPTHGILFSLSRHATAISRSPSACCNFPELGNNCRVIIDSVPPLSRDQHGLFNGHR
jgi:hypothetical protein